MTRVDELCAAAQCCEEWLPQFQHFSDREWKHGE